MAEAATIYNAAGTMDNLAPPRLTDARGSPRRTRPLLASAGGALAALGAFMLPFAIGAAGLPTPGSSPGINIVSGAIVVAVGTLMPLVLGLWLLHRGAPWLPGYLLDRLFVPGRRTFWSAAWRRLVRVYAPARAELRASPLRRAGFALAWSVSAAVVSPHGVRWIAIFVAFLLYSVGDPLLNAFEARWWLNLAKSVVGFILLFVAAAAIAGIDKLGEGGMIFVGPLIFYPWAVAGSGVIRMIRWSLARSGPAVIPTTD